ncbi:MAG: hypothetical protein PF488_01485 [Patescibacteria group bacterium]|jgi:hypothetical protein|nr:hypothetical protein [Patescibacteria group bacterium]
MSKDCYLVKNDDSLSNNLLRLFSFFDIFKHPLTFWEIKNYINETKKEDSIIILKTLDLLIEKEIIKFEKGFYFLKDSENIVDIRKKRYNYYQRKLKKAKTFSKLFSLLPFVKMIALVNMIGKFNLKDKGDIDFFIITKANSIWITRLYCAGIAKVLNSRPSKKTKKDKICLSFYISENNLNLEKLKYENGDPYFDIWEKDMDVIFDRDNYFNKFRQANLKNNNNKEENEFKSSKKILNKLEYLAKLLQLKIMPKSLIKAAKLNKGVVINNNVLKLYLVDKRLIIKEKYEQKIRNYFRENN